MSFFEKRTNVEMMTNALKTKKSQDKTYKIINLFFTFFKSLTAN